MYIRSSTRYAHATGYTSLDYADDGSQIITCGADGDIRKWTGIDDDDPSSHCVGEYVLSVAHYEKRLLVSADLNVVQAYTLPAMDRDGIPMSFTAPVTCLRANGDYVAAGSEDTIIKVLRQNEVQQVQELEGHSGPVLSVDISCHGLLASAAGDGTLRLWDLKTMKEVKTLSGLPKINTFERATYFGTPSFEPRNGATLAYVLGKEVVLLDCSTWQQKCTLTDDLVTGEYSCCRFSPDGRKIAAGTIKGELSIFDFERRQTMKCETSSSECYAITALAWNPANMKELAFCDSRGQLGLLFPGEGDHDAEHANAYLSECDEERTNAAVGNDINDDDDAISLEKLKKETMRAFTVDDDRIEVHSNASARSRQSSLSDGGQPSLAMLTGKQQPSFQPSCTPVDLEHRYLVWNSVGIVVAHQSANGDGSIDVEFHDASAHHPLHIPNFNNGYTMASLSTNALALSSDGATKFVCIALGASGNKEWSMEMRDCEGIKALVTTSKLVGVATTMNFLRLFSVMGTQREVISIAGPVLAMAGINDQLFVCHHSGPAFQDQQLSALLLHAVGMSLRSRETPVPLPASRKLTWLGYTDHGSPVIADSMGLVQIYSMKTNLWYPICDTMRLNQSASNSYFVVEVSERRQVVRAVLCRGCSYPMTAPRPIVTELPMQMPLCELESEKSTLEEVLVRNCHLMHDDAERTIKETAVKLFAIACRSELESRARELVELIASPQLLPLVIKYASKLGRIHLSERLSEMLPQLVEQNKINAKETTTMETDALTMIENSPLNRGLTSAGFGARSSMSTSASTTLAPKPMVISSEKRNSLKSIIASRESRESVENSDLSFDLQSQNSMVFDVSTSISESPISSADVDSVNHKPERNFMSWYSENKQQLEVDHPQAGVAELAKIGMAEFRKKARPSSISKTNPFAKRKLTDVDISPSSSMLYKLVKK